MSRVLGHPLVLLLAALGGPFVAVAVALLVARVVGWMDSDRRRGALVVGALACLYFGLAVAALATSESPRAVIVYAILGVLWTALALHNRLGPGSRSEDR